MAKRPKWLENALEEFGEQIVAEELDDAEVAELTGFSPRKVRLLMKEVADLEEEVADEDDDEEEEEEVVDESDDDEEEEEEDEEEEEEEEPAPRSRRGRTAAPKDKQGRARGGVKAKAIEEEEDPEDTEGPTPAKKPKRGSRKSAEELPEDELERLRVMYRKTVNGETGLVDTLNEEAEARLRSVVDYDFDDILSSVSVIDAGAKWMTIRLHLEPTELPKGRSADEKKREKLVRAFLKDIRPALDDSDGQAKIFKKNLVINEDGNGTVDLQIRIR